jgi:hypothetical protein
MKILLKKLETGLFLKDLGCWTSDSGVALNFKTTPAALDYCLKHGHFGTSIILKFVDSRYDMELKNC